MLFLAGLFIGCLFRVIITSCLAIGKYDDINSGRE